VSPSRSRVCLVTGQPGVGKTTLCQVLSETQPDRFQVLSFGQLIREEVARVRGLEVNEEALRQDVTRFVTGEVTARASEMLFDAISAGTKEWILVDSHAASQDHYGFRSTPDGPTYFKRVRYAAVIQLYLSESQLLERIRADRRGRFGTNEVELLRLFTLQVAVSTTYASRCECPLYLVDSSVGRTEVAAIATGLLNAL
jgi:adenylate kinase